MNALRNICIGAGLASLMFLVSNMSYQDAVNQAAEAEQDRQNVQARWHAHSKQCARKRSWPAVDSRGEWVCADQAPTIAMGAPVK